MKTLTIPLYSFVPAGIVSVTIKRLHKLVLVDTATQAQEVRNLVLLLLKQLWVESVSTKV